MNFYLQMYSARKTPLDDALSIVANCGYSGVELYGDNFTDASALETTLLANKLTVPSMHVGIDALRNDLDNWTVQAERFGCALIVCPFLEADRRPTDGDGWKALGLELQQIAAELARADVDFAWHNHDFEFQALGDGSMPIEHLLDNTSDVKWEIDVAWIAKAGADPLHWIEKYQQRICSVHMKDIAPEGDCADEDGWADVGEGVLPWKAIMLALGKTGATFYITEHDNPSDLQRFASRSIAAAKNY